MALAYVTSSSWTGGGSVSFDVGAGSDRLLVVLTGSTIPTYNLVSMTSLGRFGSFGLYLYYLIAPASGSNTLVMPASVSFAYAFSGADQATQMLHYTAGDASSLNITPTYNSGMLLSFLVCNSDVGGNLATSGQTNQQSLDQGLVYRVGTQATPGGGVLGTASWNVGASSQFSSGVIEIVTTQPVNLAPSLSESVTVSESITTRVLLQPVINDTATVSESVTLLEKIVFLSTFETVTVDDSQLIVHSQALNNLLFIETPIVSENITVKINLGSISVSDAATVAEVVQTISQFFINLSESVTVSEYLILGITNFNQEIFQYLSGIDDFGNSIAATVETGENSLGVQFETISYPVEILLNIPEGKNIGVFISLDGGDFLSVGIAKRGMNRLPIDISPKGDMVARCRKMRIALKEFSKSKLTVANCAVKFYATQEVEEYRD